MHWVRLSQLVLQADCGVGWDFSGVGRTLGVKDFELVLCLELALVVALLDLHRDTNGYKFRSAHL